MQSYVNSIVFVPPRDRCSLQRVRLLQRQQSMRFTSKTSGERISYYHFDQKGDPITEDNIERVVRSSIVVLYHHGNAEDLGASFNYAQSIASVFGVAVVAYDYCGYGLSGFPNAAKPSKVSEKSVYSDADHMYSHLLSLGYPAHRIVIVGRSVGGGPACYLAEKHHKEVCGLVLISTFTSCFRVVSSWCLPFFCSCFDMFPNYRRIKDILECPVLVMHGTNDDVVPYHCSSELFEDIRVRRTSALQLLLSKRGRRPEGQTSDLKTEGGAPRAPTGTTKGSTTISVPDEWHTTAHPFLGSRATDVFDLYALAHNSLSEGVKSMAEKHLNVTAADVVIGAFHRWFVGCGHNDIEEREGSDFTRMLMYFLRFAAAFSREREALASHASLAGAAIESGNPVPITNPRGRE
ncbi:hypothetical protein JKF63_02051 [Porcisia hertigi]|uniref:Serine aminopeptidase S33 domain-containing protein n=1 Tax=Porcisia hertigi TaxID=2761500 RepID=A0A836HLK1_9TRYP|nr:hypothetical protein JKF63_02051 [Porcisia hertigi]